MCRYLAAILAVCLLAPGALAQDLTRPQLLTEAERAAAAGRDPQERALCFALCAVAWQPVDETRMRAALDTALECARGANDLLIQALAMRTVAARIHAVAPERARQALSEGAAIAARLLSPDQRAIALRELAMVAADLALADPVPTVAQAIAAADAAVDPWNRALSWILLASRAEATDSGRGTALVQQALDLIAAQTEAPEERPEAISALAEAWAALDPTAAADLPARLSDPGDRQLATVALVEALAPTDFGLALSLARGTAPGLTRSEALAHLAAALPAERAAEAAEIAVSALSELPEPAPAEADLFRPSLAAALCLTDLPRALAVAGASSQPEVRDEARVAIALRIASGAPAAAREALAAVEDPRASEPARAHLATVLAGSDTSAAVSLCRGLRDRRLRVAALLGVAQALPVPAPATTGKGQ